MPKMAHAYLDGDTVYLVLDFGGDTEEAENVFIEMNNEVREGNKLVLEINFDDGDTTNRPA